MKKFFVLMAVLLLLQFNYSLAQEKTPPVESKINEEEIKGFKDKIASKVAELQKRDQRPVTGFVTKNDDNQIEIKTPDKQIYQVKIDDVLTKIFQISGSSKKEVDLSSLVKNDYLIVTGPITDKTISANYIFVDESYLVRVGRVTEVDKENFSVKLVTPEKDEITLEVETATKQLMLNIKTLMVEKSGFSKIKEGDTIHFIVKKTQIDKEEASFSAFKILTIPQEYFIR